MSKCQNVKMLTSMLVLILSSVAKGQINSPVGDPEIGELPKASTMELVWNDLFGENFDSDKNGMYLRTDLPTQVGDQDGYQVAVLDIFGETEEDVDVHIGAAFVEYSRYTVQNFYGETEYFEDNGVVYPVESQLEVVSGTLVNMAGESRIVVGYVYVMDFIGIDIFQGSGVAFQYFMPTNRALSLEIADNRAFDMSHISTEVDVADCIGIEDYCLQQKCFCMADEDARFENDTGLCDGVTNPAVVFGTGVTVGVATGIAAGKAGAKRGPWVAFWAAIGGGTAGVVVVGVTVEGILDRDCRVRANARHQKYKRLIQNELARCLVADPPEFDCPVPTGG